MHVLRKLAITGSVALCTLALTGANAFAFECYNANRSAQGNASAAGSQGFFTIEEALINFEGLCQEGADFVIAGLDEQGFQTDVLINAHTLMAGGLEKNGKGEEKLHDGQGIDHLSDEFFAAAGPLIEEAHGMCGD